MVLAMGLNFLSSIITSRALGLAAYGDFKFIQTLWALLALVINFGLLHAGSRVLLLEHDSTRSREIAGTVLLLALAMGTMIAGVIMALAWPVDHLLHTELAPLLIAVAPLAAIIPLQTAVTLALQSTNRIVELAVLNSIPPLIYLVILWTLSQVVPISTGMVLLLQQGSALLLILAIALRLRPRWRSTRHWWDAIRAENKTYGFPVYVGALAGVASGKVNGLAISYWADNSAVGVFYLATHLVNPLTMIPQAVATSSFRDFARQPRVPKRVLAATIVVSFLSLVGSWILFGKPLHWLYTGEFASRAGPMASVAAVGAILSGFGDFYNRFLGAHGKGTALRNTAFLVGLVNAVGFVALVPLWGAWGAIVTTVIAGAAYLLFMLISYTRYVRQAEVAAGKA